VKLVTDEATAPPDRRENADEEVPAAERAGGRFLLRLALAVGAPLAGIGVLWAALAFLRDTDANRALIVLVALAVGVGGVFFLFWAMDQAVDALPERVREGTRPYLFVGPALVLLSVFLVYPVVNTVVVSLKDASSQDFVGLDNYRFVFTDESMLRSIRNTLGWIVLVPLVAVSIGLAFATLADRLRHGEAVAKSMIFLPMAISFVGASVVWTFIYDFRPEGFGEQIGILNAIGVALGRDPVNWMQLPLWNNLLLMIILVWLQTGFAMVILSSAIKSVPDDQLEAARIDGANEWHVFRRIVIPSISSTIVVVWTTILITTWKVFDIVWVMTGGQFGTSVVAERMVTEFFTFNNDGMGAALAVILFVAVVPILVINVNRFRQQEATR